MPDYGEDEIRQDGLYEKLVFIVGNARSGTTIIANILNMSESVFVMEEANLFIHLTKTEFPKWFNTMHCDLGKPPRKGTYVPQFESEEETGLVTLRRLARDHDFVATRSRSIRWGPSTVGPSSSISLRSTLNCFVGVVIFYR